jgi:hypothetical protein
MKIYLKSIFALFLLTQVNVSAQSITDRIDFSINAGYGSFNMQQLKDINDYQKELLPFDVMRINNFDPGFYFGGSLKTRVLPEVTVGVFYQYLTTGSRLGRKDYSGYYVFDQIADGHFTGLEPEITVLNNKPVCLAIAVQAGVLFSGLKMKNNLKLGDSENTDLQKLRASSVALAPVLKISSPVYHSLRIFLSAGGMIDTGGKLHLPGKKDAVLLLNDEKVKTNWSGWRINIGLNLNLVNN